RNAALATGIARSSYLPQLSVATMGGWQNGHLSSSTALGQAGADISHHGAISVVSLQWLLFDFGERAGVGEGGEEDKLGGEHCIHRLAPAHHPRGQRGVLPLPGTPLVDGHG